MVEKVTRHEIDGLIVVAHWHPNKLGPVQLTINLKNPGDDNFGINNRRMARVVVGDIRPLPEKPEGDLFDVLDWLEENASRRQGGHQAYPPEFWARVALAYVLAMAEGHRDPEDYIAGMVDIRPHTIARWVLKAREHGYLTRVTRGHNGGIAHGELTDRAKQVLGQVEGE